MHNIIFLSNDSNIPKYKQIVTTVQNAVEQGRLKPGDMLPSFNQLCKKFDISRDTVIKAYQELKSLGLVSASPGKGNYISSSGRHRKRHVFLLFDEFSAYKEILFNNLESTLRPQGRLDLYFHHFNETLFFDLVRQGLGKYTDYVIMPFSTKESFGLFSELFQNENIYILDQGGCLYGEAYPSVYQDFEQGIYDSLLTAAESIEKYNRFLMIINPPENDSRRVMTEQISDGFFRFCKQFNLIAQIRNSIHNFRPQPGDCFFVHSDRELVSLFKIVHQKAFVPGRDVGIISFNDAPLKEITAGGITTISTDFERMGRTMAEMVLNHSRAHIKNPIRLIHRNTL